MGTVVISGLNRLVRGQPYDSWYELQDSKHGKLRVQLLAVDFGREAGNETSVPIQQENQPYYYQQAPPMQQTTNHSYQQSYSAPPQYTAPSAPVMSGEQRGQYRPDHAPPPTHYQTPRMVTEPSRFGPARPGMGSTIAHGVATGASSGIVGGIVGGVTSGVMGRMYGSSSAQNQTTIIREKETIIEVPEEEQDRYEAVSPVEDEYDEEDYDDYGDDGGDDDYQGEGDYDE